MHIAYLTSEYPHERVLHSAGIGTSIKNLADALIENGHEVTLFVYGQQKSDVFKEDGITFHLIAQKKYPIGGFYFYRKHISRYFNKHSKSIDILEAADWTGITAFCDFRVPHVIRLHGSDTYFCHLEKRAQKRKNFLFEKRALQSATAIVSVSKFTALKTKTLFNLSHQIPVIHNIINLDEFIPDHQYVAHATILNVGTVIRKKGVIALAKAFNMLAKEHPTLQLQFVGNDVRDVQTGAMTSELIKNEIHEAALNRVYFTGAVPHSQVQEYVKKATVVCLPSYAEAFPMTWLEAMALEKPLITSNIGWASEIMIHNKTGFCVDPNDGAAFYRSIVKMLLETENATKFGKNARKHLETNFTASNVIAENLEFYKNAINL